MNKIKLPVGTSSFESIITEGMYFVDKSYVISDIIRDNASTLLFTRPRRFGKTTILTMLSSFFDITKDSKALFSSLKIMEDKEAVESYLNKYPVVFISFRNVKASTFEDALLKLTDALLPIFENNNYLIREDTIEASRNLFSDILSGNPEKISIMRSITYLVRLMSKHYKKKVILLVDEYDVPLDSAEQNGYYPQMLSILRAIFEVLKDDDNIKFAVLTGCLRVSKESLFTGLNNLASYSLLSENYASAFGFTDEEVDLIIEKTDLQSVRNTVKKWYDGYNIAGISIYSTWDVVSYVNEAVKNSNTSAKNFWANVSENAVIKRFIVETNASIKDEYSTLIDGGIIYKNINESLTYGELYKNEDSIWSLLFETGYLTLAEPYDPSKPTALILPNEEIKDLFKKVVIDWFSEKMEKEDKSELYKALFLKDEEKLGDIISQMLLESISYHDYGEDFYHAFLTGIFYAPHNFEVKSNREQGKGRPDLFIRDLNKKRVAILEFKAVKEEKYIESALKEALKQIKEKQYDFDFSLKGFEVLKYAVVFYKKSAEVRLLIE